MFAREPKRSRGGSWLRAVVDVWFAAIPLMTVVLWVLAVRFGGAWGLIFQPSGFAQLTWEIVFVVLWLVGWCCFQPLVLCLWHIHAMRITGWRMVGWFALCLTPIGPTVWYFSVLRGHLARALTTDRDCFPQVRARPYALAIAAVVLIACLIPARYGLIPFLLGPAALTILMLSLAVHARGLLAKEDRVVCTLAWIVYAWRLGAIGGGSVGAAVAFSACMRATTEGWWLAPLYVACVAACGAAFGGISAAGAGVLWLNAKWKDKPLNRVTAGKHA